MIKPLFPLYPQFFSIQWNCKLQQAPFQKVPSTECPSKRSEVESSFKNHCPTDAHLSSVNCQCEFMLLFNGCLISFIQFTKHLHQMKYIMLWEMNGQDVQMLIILFRRLILWSLRILSILHLFLRCGLFFLIHTSLQRICF